MKDTTLNKKVENVKFITVFLYCFPVLISLITEIAAMVVFHDSLDKADFLMLSLFPLAVAFIIVAVTAISSELS